jgi:hopene-associated glycosyltransferase HpnB
MTGGAVLTAIGAASAAIWFYLIAFRGGFWRIVSLPAAEGAVPSRKVVAVIPARDEAEAIGPALTSLFAQDYPGALQVIVVDDGSSDGTAVVARAAAEAAGALERLTVVAGAPLPAGWTGKLWAMRQGVERAQAASPDYLLLTDADIVHGRTALRDLVAQAERGYGLVSLMVRLNCTSGWERLLIPAFEFFFFKLYPPRRVASRRARTAAAAGGCMLVRPEVLVRIGGIDSIRAEIIDDCALARQVKAREPIWLGAAPDTGSIRAYRSARPIWDMIARSAFAQLGYAAAMVPLTLAMMALTYLAPPLLAVSGSWPAMVPGGVAWLAMTVAYVPSVRRYRCAPRWALTLPLAALFYTAATVGSAVMYWRGRGGMWKGRFQAAAGR